MTGGNNNTASGDRSAVCGGDANIASGTRSSISGGFTNDATAFSWIGGGQNNLAGGALADYDARHADLVAQRKLLAEREDEASQLALERLEGLDTIGAPDFDAVLLPQGGKRLQAIAPLLAYYDVDPAEVRYLGTAHWDDVRLGTEPALAGGWFTAPPPALWRSFRDRYKETYNKVPPRIAALAYDATALAAVLTRRALETGRDPDFGPDVLTQPSGFAGIDGVFRFLPTGEVQRRLAVLELRRGGFQVLDRAPNDFRQFGF